MPSEVRVVGQKFYSKYDNGNTFASNLSNFSQHLKGGVLEEIKAVFNVQVSWFSKLAANTSTTYYDNVAVEFTVRNNGLDFKKEGFAIGDTVKYSDPAYKIDGDILAITGGEMIISVTTLTGVKTPNVWGTPSSDQYITGVTSKTALEYKFGLIENDESPNYLSKLTNTEQIYRVEGIDHTLPNPPASNGVSFGSNKAWVTGSFTTAFVGLSFDNDPVNTSNTTQEFQIEHIFKINPFYRDGELDSLQDIDTPPDDIFEGNKSLKYVFQTEFRTTLNNPNTSNIAEYDTELGSVGYLDESFNGYASDYTVDALVYDVSGDTVDEISIGEVTNVAFDILSSDSTFTANTDVIVGHTSIINSLSYSSSPNDYDTLWTNESLRTNTADIALSGTLIKNYKATYVNAGKISIVFDVEFTTPQTRILNDGQDYLLYYTIADPTKTVDQGSKVTGRIDVNVYDKNGDISGLFDVETLEQYPLPYEFEKGVTTGFTSGKMFIEDNQMCYARFKVLNTYLGEDLDLLEDVTLDSLKFKIVAYNTVENTWFDLRTLNIDLSNQVQSGNTQNIELDDIRGYIETDDDIFNSLILSTDNNDGTYQFYDLQVGYKIPWQAWLELIGADTIFYDKTKNQNNLNQSAATYSFTNNYVIKILIDADVETTGITTNYVKRTGDFLAYDYNTDDQEPDAYSCVINTFKEDGSALENNIIEKGFTEIKAIITPNSPPVFSQSVDFTEVANDWGRYSHGNQFIGDVTAERLNGLSQIEVSGSWDNEQAGEINGTNDTFQSFLSGGDIADKFKLLQQAGVPITPINLYLSSSNTITTISNLTAFYGCKSLIEYEYYSITGKMYSAETDNDILAYNICFYTDIDGVEHSLSLVATTGGYSIEINDSANPYIFEDNTTKIFTNELVSDGYHPKWAIVVDFGKSGWSVIDKEVIAGQSIIGWDDAGDFDFTVNRSSNNIEVITSWNLPLGLQSKTFNIDLNSLVDTELNQFNGFQKIGFGFMSQAAGGFKEVVLTLPSSDFYGVIRMETEDGASDFGKNEISDIIATSETSLLKQSSGDERKLILSYDGTDFILQANIETANIVEGETYTFSALLRRKDLIL